MYVKREGNVHSIRELEVSSKLKLNNIKDYITGKYFCFLNGQCILSQHKFNNNNINAVIIISCKGYHQSRSKYSTDFKYQLTHFSHDHPGDNSDIIATDTQKNTVYILAKKFGVTSPEQFALLMCDHYLSRYSHVVKVRVQISERPWSRIQSERGQSHNHAFVSIPEALRSTIVTRSRDGESFSWPTIFPRVFFAHVGLSYLSQTLRPRSRHLSRAFGCSRRPSHHL